MKTYAILVAICGERHKYRCFAEILDKLLVMIKDDYDVLILTSGKKAAEYSDTFCCTREFKTMNANIGDTSMIGNIGIINAYKIHSALTNYKKRGCVLFWDGKSENKAQHIMCCKKYDTPIRIYNWSEERWEKDE